jgi:hypothetical protein
MNFELKDHLLQSTGAQQTDPPGRGEGGEGVGQDATETPAQPSCLKNPYHWFFDPLSRETAVADSGPKGVVGFVLGAVFPLLAILASIDAKVKMESDVLSDPNIPNGMLRAALVLMLNALLLPHPRRILHVAWGVIGFGTVVWFYVWHFCGFGVTPFFQQKCAGNGGSSPGATCCLDGSVVQGWNGNGSNFSYVVFNNTSPPLARACAPIHEEVYISTWADFLASLAVVCLCNPFLSEHCKHRLSWGILKRYATLVAAPFLIPFVLYLFKGKTSTTAFEIVATLVVVIFIAHTALTAILNKVLTPGLFFFHLLLAAASLCNLLLEEVSNVGSCELASLAGWRGGLPPVSVFSVLPHSPCHYPPPYSSCIQVPAWWHASSHPCHPPLQLHSCSPVCWCAFTGPL